MELKDDLLFCYFKIVIQLIGIRRKIISTTIIIILVKEGGIR